MAGAKRQETVFVEKAVYADHFAADGNFDGTYNYCHHCTEAVEEKRIDTEGFEKAAPFVMSLYVYNPYQETKEA